MAEEEVVAVAESHAPLDHKRKLEDLEKVEPASEEPTETNGDCESATADLVDSEETGAKRLKLDDQPDGSASENGHQDEKVEAEPVKENDSEPIHENSQSEAVVSQPDEAPGKANDELPSDDAQTLSVRDSEGTREQENEPPVIEANQQQPDSPTQQDQPTSDSESITRRMEVPSNKVGALIGKAGDTIRSLQYSSGAKIQVMRDGSDPQCTTRPVEIIGSLDSVQKAEKLIAAVITEAEAGGSHALVARGHGASQGVTEQIEMPIPNDKVGLVIGRGGETIKGLQTRSGARIQHLSGAGDSRERTVRVTGDKRQIDIAWEMIKEVMNQNMRSSSGQQGNRARGPHQWGPPRGHHMAPPDYQQRGPHNPPRGWDQRPPQHQHGGPYNYHGGQKGHSAPPNYNYGHPPPYSQPPNPQQNFNHGYDNHHYANSQPYQHAGPPTGYSHHHQPPPQQYNKPPPYGMPPQQYGPLRPNQNEVPYQAPAPAQSYEQSAPPQQQPYPYGSTQQPPYYGGPAPPAEAYGQAQAQAPPVANYGQYVTPQAYGEQAAGNTAGYGYQGLQDPAYGAVPPAGQPIYGAPPAAQGYDQAAPPAGGYGGKTVSPQPQAQAQAGFVQYESAQMYAQPH